VRKVVALCPEQTAPGLALAGVETHVYATVQQAAEQLRALLQAADAGVVLVDDAVLDALDVPLRRRAEESDLPLVVAIPMGPGRALEREYLEQMIRRVIGYQVRLR